MLVCLVLGLKVICQFMIGIRVTRADTAEHDEPPHIAGHRQIDQSLRAVAIDLVGHLIRRIPARSGSKYHHVTSVGYIIVELREVGFALLDAFGKTRSVRTVANHRHGIETAVVQFADQTLARVSGRTG